MIQVQPKYLMGEQWLKLSEEKNLFFESLEIFSPPIIGNAEATDNCTEWYRNCGRTRSLHGAFIDINPASGDPLIKKISYERCRESCITARKIGAKYVVFHGSCFPFLRGGYIDHWVNTCAEFYDTLAAEYNDLVICIENSFDVNTEPLEKLMNKISNSNVCVCLDFGHANYSSVPMKDWFLHLGEKIGYLHLSDNIGRFDDHLNIGCGIIDWKEADKLYRSLGRELPITFEVGGIEGVIQSLDYLEKNSLFL